MFPKKAAVEACFCHYSLNQFKLWFETNYGKNLPTLLSMYFSVQLLAVYCLVA